MPVAGVVVMVVEQKGDAVLSALEEMEEVTTYGIHKKNYIVAVLEGDSSRHLEEISGRIQAIDGVLGVFPAYVGFDEEEDPHSEAEAMQRVVS